MGITQTKRQQAFDTTVAANALASIVLRVRSDPCNIHGLILDVHVGNTGVGLSFGQWCVVLMPRADTTIPVMTTAGINTEDANPIFWMLGNWMTHETGGIDHIGGAPKSSRNCGQAGVLRFIIENSPVSGSTVRIHGTASWFETAK